MDLDDPHAAVRLRLRELNVVHCSRKCPLAHPNDSLGHVIRIQPAVGPDHANDRNIDCGKMSVGVVTIEATPKIAISSATMTNVYGLFRAKRTINIKPFSRMLSGSRLLTTAPDQLNLPSLAHGAPSTHVVRANLTRATG